MFTGILKDFSELRYHFFWKPKGCFFGRISRLIFINECVLNEKNNQKSEKQPVQNARWTLAFLLVKCFDFLSTTKLQWQNYKTATNSKCFMY